MQVGLVFGQVEDRIPDELTGSVKGDITPALDVKEFDTPFFEFLG